MGKSAEAFRTISEVADLLDTPSHVLRFWESKFSQIKPVKRAGGRRYYRPSDVALLGGIKHLLHEQGLTIRGVQKVLREDGIRSVSALSTVTLTDETAETPASQPAPAPEPTERQGSAAPHAELETESRSPAEAAEPEPEETTSAEEAAAPDTTPTPDEPEPVPSSVTPFPRKPDPAPQPSFFDAPEEEAPIALDVEPEPEPASQVYAMTIERKDEAPAATATPSLARLLHGLRVLDASRLSPADRGDLRMLRLRAQALQLRLAKPAEIGAE
ncbi:MerR family transcriptional regulator [Thioclava atlantica]|uniref:MerR family transcriptional regulator n=1 Tax=Thioclava atlantica TaxID=1317124 RepID=A0A085TSQ1_9RHOB|nr:MerR family transcriptional regulator [Thioclava atlantica]KFE33748.1 MerR family transcriptional regulator [Thioclava atlantica]